MDIFSPQLPAFSDEWLAKKIQAQRLKLAKTTAAEPEAKPLDPDAFLAHFYAQEDRLLAKGFHRIPPWWRQELERFVRSGHRRWVVRSGRRGGKSTMLCRLSAAIVTFGAYL